jgi:hypothetical protein
MCSFANAPITILCGEEGSNFRFEAKCLFCALLQDEGTRSTCAFCETMVLLRTGLIWHHVCIITTDASCNGHGVNGFDDKPTIIP